MTWQQVINNLIIIEKKGIEFYEYFRQQVDDPEVLSVLRYCQQGEEDHRDYLERVYQQLAEGEKLDFKEGDTPEGFQFPDRKRLTEEETLKEAIILAIRVEHRTIDYLNQVRQSFDDPSKINLIEYLINEEQEHINSLVKLSQTR